MTLEEEDLVRQYREAVEQSEELKRYERVNRSIDNYKRKKGVDPKFIIPGGKYATLYMHPEYEMKWRGTFFDKERGFIESGLRKINSLENFRYYEMLGKSKRYTNRFLGYCDIAVACENGVRFHLVDPHGDVWLHQYNMPQDTARIYSGKMLVAEIDFTPKGNIVTQVFDLQFTLTEEITKDNPRHYSKDDYEVAEQVRCGELEGKTLEEEENEFERKE